MTKRVTSFQGSTLANLTQVDAGRRRTPPPFFASSPTMQHFSHRVTFYRTVRVLAFCFTYYIACPPTLS